MNTRSKSAAARARDRSRRRSVSAGVVVGIVALVVAVVTVIAIVAGSGGSDDAADPDLIEVGAVDISGTALPPAPDGGTDAGIGAVAPTVTGTSFDGSSVSIEHGRTTLLVFLAHWCPHCQREVPVLTQWAADGAVPEGIDVIGVATGTNPDRPNYPPSAWLEREQFPFPVLVDSATYDTATAFGLSGFPFFVVLDPEGNVTARASGELDVATLDEMLEQAR